MKTFVAPLVGVFLLLGVIAGARSVIPMPVKPEASVVMVKLSPQGHGSGVYIGNGQFLTAAHVAVEAADGHVTIVNGAGAEFTATVVWMDAARDVALLQADGKQQGVKAAALACQLPDAATGEAIVSIGYPMDLGRTKTWGRIAGTTRDIPTGGDETLAARQIADITTGPGNSGGGLFDNLGRIVGLTEAGYQGLAIDIFIPRSTICAAIQAHTQQVAENTKGN